MSTPLKALFPGTFNILTNGHLDLIRRGAELFDELIVVIAKNDRKAPLFCSEERARMARECTSQWPNVSVVVWDGLMVDLARQLKAKAMIRGLRFVSDFEFELQMAIMNHSMAPEVETLFLSPSPEWSSLSSSLIHEIAARGGDVDKYVPAPMAAALRARLRARRQL